MTIEESVVRDLVEHLIADRGFDLEDVILSSSPSAGSSDAGSGTDEVRLVVDRDGGADLDALGDLTRAINETLDAAPDLSADTYTVEVTSPGIGRPLTLPRHWRRATGRKVRLTLLDGGHRDGRIGRVGADDVEIVTNTRGRIGVASVRYDAVDTAVTDVDFTKPSVAELRLCGLDDDEITRRRESGSTQV